MECSIFLKGVYERPLHVGGRYYISEKDEHKICERDKDIYIGCTLAIYVSVPINRLNNDDDVRQGNVIVTKSQTFVYIQDDVNICFHNKIEVDRSRVESESSVYHMLRDKELYAYAYACLYGRRTKCVLLFLKNNKCLCLNFAYTYLMCKRIKDVDNG